MTNRWLHLAAAACALQAVPVLAQQPGDVTPDVTGGTPSPVGSIPKERQPKLREQLLQNLLREVLKPRPAPDIAPPAASEPVAAPYPAPPEVPRALPQAEIPPPAPRPLPVAIPTSPHRPTSVVPARVAPKARSVLPKAAAAPQTAEPVAEVKPSTASVPTRDPQQPVDNMFETFPEPAVPPPAAAVRPTSVATPPTSEKTPWALGVIAALIVAAAIATSTIRKHRRLARTRSALSLSPSLDHAAGSVSTQDLNFAKPQIAIRARLELGAALYG